jgi:hypothetical protein
MSLLVKWVSYRQQIVGSWVLIHPAISYLSVGELRPFTFSVIERCVQIPIIYFFLDGFEYSFISPS